MAPVVVLPWLPATAMVSRSPSSSASAWARVERGSPAARAARSSTLSAGMAGLKITRDAPLTASAW